MVFIKYVFNLKFLIVNCYFIEMVLYNGGGGAKKQIIPPDSNKLMIFILLISISITKY